jgi:hypothetical protein
MRLIALLLAAGLLAVPAAAQELLLAASRPGTVAPLQIWASFAEGGWAVRVADGAGRERQRFAVPSEAAETAPWIGDADGDGAGDLFVPMTASGAGIAWQLWIMDPRLGQFRLAGEVGGTEFARDAGWLVAQGRQGCCTVMQTFYGFQRGGAALREAFAIERRLLPDGRVQRCAGGRGAPQDVVRPWCNAATGSWPPGITPLR